MHRNLYFTIFEVLKGNTHKMEKQSQIGPFPFELHYPRVRACVCTSDRERWKPYLFIEIKSVWSISLTDLYLELIAWSAPIQRYKCTIPPDQWSCTLVEIPSNPMHASIWVTSGSLLLFKQFMKDCFVHSIGQLNRLVTSFQILYRLAAGPRVRTI